MRSSADAYPHSGRRKGGESNESRFSTRSSPCASPYRQEKTQAPSIFQRDPEPRRRTERGEGTAAGATPSFLAVARQKTLFSAGRSKGRSRRGSVYVSKAAHHRLPRCRLGQSPGWRGADTPEWRS